MKVRRWSVLILGLCLALLLLLGGFIKSLGSGLRALFLPLVRTTASAASSLSSSLGLLDHQNSPERLRDLETRLSRLALDYAKLQALEEENAALRAQANFLKTSGFDHLGARVISRDFSEGRSFLLIDRGLNDGVEKGQAVVVSEGIFIGKVATVKERVALVQLLSDPHSRVAAALATETKLLGVVEGKGNGTAMLTYVPSSETIKRDQIVVTSGTEEKIPGNLVLGMINAVQGKPTDPFLSAPLEPLFPGDRIVFVSLLRPTALRPNL